MALADKIAVKSSLTVSTGKRAFYAKMDLAAAYDYASKIMVDNMLARDAEEGISAFIEKDRPSGAVSDGLCSTLIMKIAQPS